MAEIRWTAADGTGLSENPISLYYSTDGGTTYNVIASSIANTGTYNWTVPNLHTSSEKIKIEARDTLNNLSTDETTSSFSIQLAAQEFYFESGVSIQIPIGSGKIIVSR